MDNNELLIEHKNGSERYYIYANRVEIVRRRMLTLGLTTKKETYPYSDVRRVSVQGRYVSLEISVMRGVGLRLTKEKAKEFEQIVNAAL